jgi:hypothetical protein
MRRPLRTALTALAITTALATGGCAASGGSVTLLDTVLRSDRAAHGAGRILHAAASPATTTDPLPSRSPKAPKQPGADGGGGPPASAPVPAAPVTRYGFPGSVILGRPTATSAALSVLASSNLSVYAEYGKASGRYTARTPTIALVAGKPAVLSLTGLTPNAATYYRLRYRAKGATTFSAATQQSFRTQRAAGAAFTFAVEADPHVDVDRKMQPALFRAALANIRATRPDFLVDLGDTFLGDKFATSSAELAVQYANVRNYVGIVGPSVPLFLVNGNHEGEAGWLLDGTADNLAVWAATHRKSYYPVPAVGSFYSGSAVKAPFVGERDSYYAWEWGDALFVVLDPYGYSTTSPKQSGDVWDWTLGDAQYAWLEKTLASSDATYRFVFSHHVLGEGRGMIELADLGEWGGEDKDGTDMFAAQRPGWEMPVHDLFVKYGVTIFFQGHDHLYARQELDGVVYQEVPQPATTGDPANESAYRSGTILGAPGTLKVTVASTGVTVAYIRSSIGAGGTPASDNGTIVASYTVSKPSGR